MRGLALRLIQPIKLTGCVYNSKVTNFFRSVLQNPNAKDLHLRWGCIKKGSLRLIDFDLLDSPTLLINSPAENETNFHLCHSYYYTLYRVHKYQQGKTQADNGLSCRKSVSSFPSA